MGTAPEVACGKKVVMCMEDKHIFCSFMCRVRGPLVSMNNFASDANVLFDTQYNLCLPYPFQPNSESSKPTKNHPRDGSHRNLAPGCHGHFKEAPLMQFWLFKQRSNHISACITNIIEITSLNDIDQNNFIELIYKF